VLEKKRLPGFLAAAAMQEFPLRLTAFDRIFP
jgi:hypothetical protein